MPSRTSVGVISIERATKVISRRPICLPSNSGVRPTISPAMKTVMTTITSIEYRPVPTPPGESSPSIMFSRATPPPSGCSEECIASTAPVEVPVVAEAKIADQAGPKRCSLPSMLAPAVSIQVSSDMAPKARTAIAPAIARPCRRSLTIRP